MIRKRLADIAAMAGGTLSDPRAANAVVSGVSRDTRDISRGNLYIPLVGERFDGHLFAEEAAARGAAACLWQEDRPNPPASIPAIVVRDTLDALQRLASEYRRQLNLKIVGITGSNGKTTTKDLTAALLSAKYRVHKTAGNYNNHIGLPLTILQLDETVEIAVLEMGMSGRGEIERLSLIAEPDIAIVTNIGEAHLLQLGSREEIARAKLEITAGLKQGGLLIYNGDEPLIEQALAEQADRLQAASLQTIRFGSQPANDLFPLDIRMEGSATEFAVNAAPQVRWTIPVLGGHNVINALSAIAAGSYLGMDVQAMAGGLKTAVMTGMRIEALQTPNRVTVLNDAYNASPTAMQAAIQLLETLAAPGRKYAVLGDMLELGPREADFHRKLGQSIDPGKVEAVYAYGPLSVHTAEGARERFARNKVFYFDDKEALADALCAIAQPGDAVLIKGSRGMRMETVAERLMQLGGT